MSDTLIAIDYVLIPQFFSLGVGTAISSLNNIIESSDCIYPGVADDQPVTFGRSYEVCQIYAAYHTTACVFPFSMSVFSGPM